MTTYTMRDDGYPFKKIVSKGKWVGRVFKIEGSGYRGKIGEVESAIFSSEVDAFEDVVAKRLGYANVAALRSKNAAVRARNAEVRSIANEILGGNFSALDRLFDMEKKQ
jgi:hypothetical protein